MYIFIWTEAFLFNSIPPSLSLSHQRQACLFFWCCWSSPSHNKRRTPSQCDRDEVMGRRHISLCYQGLGTVIGEETIGSCQLETHTLVLTAVQSPGWVMSDGHCGHHCPLRAARLIPEPWPAQPSLPVLTAPSVPSCLSQGHPTREHDEDLNYLQHAQEIKCQSCPPFTAHSGSPMLPTWHRSLENGWEVMNCTIHLLTFLGHGILPLLTGSAHQTALNWCQPGILQVRKDLSYPWVQPLTQQCISESKMRVLVFPHRWGCQQALTQPPKLMRDTLLWHHISFISVFPSCHKPHLLSTLLPWQLKQFLPCITMDSLFLFCSAAESWGSDVRQTKHLLWH